MIRSQFPKNKYVLLGKKYKNMKCVIVLMYSYKPELGFLLFGCLIEHLLTQNYRLNHIISKIFLDFSKYPKLKKFIVILQLILFK